MFLVSLPLIIFISIIIFFTAGSPVFYLQKRSGLNKKPFTIYKFRTMELNASDKQSKLQHLNQAPKPMFKIHNDPRFVGVGRWLSNTGLDELPQLLNIIKGEMSLVGPRPLPTPEASKLSKKWDFRFLVKPGLFSYWTLDDRRHDSLESWMELEVQTIGIKNVSENVLVIKKTLYRQIIVSLLKNNIVKFFNNKL